MKYYRCDNPDCGFLTEEEPDVCPRCGGTFFQPVDEEEFTGSDWVQMGNRAVDEDRDTDALGVLPAGRRHGRCAGIDESGLVPGGRRWRGGVIPRQAGGAVCSGRGPGTTYRL